MSDLKITDGDDTVEFQLDGALAREAALREELTERKRKHLRSCQIAIGKSQLAKERHAELIQLREAYESMRDRKNSIVDLQQRLTAAEQRNEALETAIRHTLDDSSEDAQTGEITIMRLDFETLAALIDEPTESGAS